MKKPNILLIMTDQQRFDTVSYLGNKLKLTPNIDKIALESTVFTNAYTAAPTCGPARAALQTGMYPAGCGVVENLSSAREGIDFLAERLLKQGYDTGHSGKLHFSPHDKSYGYNFKKLHDAPYSVYADEDKDSLYIQWLQKKYASENKEDPVKIFDKDESSFDNDIYKFIMGSNFRTDQEHDTPWTVDRSIDFLEQRDKDKPFFLATSFFGPHHPYGIPEPWQGLYKKEDIDLPDNFDASMDNNPVFQKKASQFANRLKSTFTRDQYKEMIAANYGQITMIDHYIGQLIDYLKDKKLYEDTIIIFTSDHGDFLGSYGLLFKGHLYDSCCKVPMLVKLTSPSENMIIKDENVNTLDLYGTILEFAGDHEWKTEDIESRSLVGILKDEEKAWDNRTYAVNGNSPESATLMMRKDKYKIIRCKGLEGENIYELYDLEKDPSETINIYDSLDKTIKLELKAEIDDWTRIQFERFPKEIISYRKR